MSPQAIQNIPEYLQPYIVRQDPSLYTAIDHASWRFILKISKAFFAKYAHEKYLIGLRETGISSDRIPLIEEMDKSLGMFGWRAVAVSGFVPPAIFMEFLSLGILPIACDMRKLENLAYTPAPDIVHEAAGHAPMISDAEYERYLRNYGEVSRKAIYSSQDMEVYHAIRNLSEIKENPRSTPSVVAAAQKRLDETSAKVTFLSEAALLARMNWWTIEYGLVGDISNPKIYGAGLLSSVGESYHCLGKNVQKIPLTVSCVDVNYDITKPQPQLFVAKNFPSLSLILEELANKMAFRRGGFEGLTKAKMAATTTTTVLDTGVAASGTLVDFRSRGNDPVYLMFKGPTQLSFGEQELPGHGAAYHKEGFGTPLGSFDGFLSLAVGNPGKLTFASGVTVEGVYKGQLEKKGKPVVLTFEKCTVRYGEEVLFKPEWGTFDMILGEKVVSVHGGAADRRAYFAATGGFKQSPGSQKSNLIPSEKPLDELYARVRKMRETGQASIEEIGKILNRLEIEFPWDWLLRYEILEIASRASPRPEWLPRLRAKLEEIGKLSKDRAELIARGLDAL